MREVRELSTRLERRAEPVTVVQRGTERRDDLGLPHDANPFRGGEPADGALRRPRYYA